MRDNQEEIENIKARYKKRNSKPGSYSTLYSQYITEERNKVYAQLLHGHFGNDLNKVRVLEIGAGTGGNIDLFVNLGIKRENIYLNELLEERLKVLREKHPIENIFPGNALEIPDNLKFDIIFQSTVFTSILDSSFRRLLAEKMQRLCEENGAILWYDFIYNNPSNTDVRKVDKEEVRKLFKCYEIKFRSVTLAPPIGRRVGLLYNLINKGMPFLRTHIAALIVKSD